MIITIVITGVMAGFAGGFLIARKLVNLGARKHRIELYQLQLQTEDNLVKLLTRIEDGLEHLMEDADGALQYHGIKSLKSDVKALKEVYNEGN